jgi:hypothetical protein
MPSALRETASEEIEVHFSADNSLLRELGERLVSRPSIALAELVKNSYDADATQVLLKFEGISRRGGKITIKDNGEGMVFDVFSRAWMRIATDEKIRNPRSSKFHRSRTGSKGVGRFACQVLARKLSLESVGYNKDGKCERIMAVFDWDVYTAGRSLTEIPVICRREILLSGAHETGTTLTLEETRTPWTEEELSDLRRDIVSLVTPFPWQPESFKLKGSRKDDPGFEVKFDIPEYPDFEGPTSRRILDHAWAVLTGHVDLKGVATYELKETSTKRRHTFTPTTSFPKIGQASYTVYFFVYKGEYFPGVDIGLRAMQLLGRRFGGVRVYLDDFRVFRYGEPGDDWLELEFDRSRRITERPEELSSEHVAKTDRPMLLLPGNNQLFGAVFLSRSANPNIDLTITRDRLLDNEAFRQLKHFVRLGIDWMTVRYAAATEKERQKRREKPKDPVALLDSLGEEIREHEKELGTATGLLLTSVGAAKRAVVSEKERMIGELAMLRVLASTGTMISVFIHELAVLLSDLRSVCMMLRRHSPSLPGPTKDNFVKTLDQLDDWISSVEQESLLLGILVGRPARQQRKPHVLRQIVQTLFQGFEHHLEDYGIETSIRRPLERHPSSSVKLRQYS